MNDKMQMKDQKKVISNRLSRLEGQIGAVRRMIENGDECEKIVTQLSAVHAALEGATKLVVAGYFQECLQQCEEKGQTQEEAIGKIVSLLLNTRM